MLEKMLALQNKRKKEGGFTLVELIVVLVILAILAALLIPALTGYIDKARDKQIVAETRQAVMAVQTMYDEAYGKGVNGTVAATVDFAGYKTATNDADLSKVMALAELTGRGSITNIDLTNGRITALSWQHGTDGKTCAYNGTDYTVN